MPPSRPPSTDVRYDVNLPPTVDETIALLRGCSLGARRPIDDPSIVARMLEYGNLTVTARRGGELIGLSRTLTDFAYVGYLSDLAVDDRFQRRGIGVELIRLTRARLGPRAMLVLLAAPAATEYYPRIGFERVESAWILRPGVPLAGDHR